MYSKLSQHFNWVVLCKNNVLFCFVLVPYQGMTKPKSRNMTSIAVSWLFTSTLPNVSMFLFEAFIIRSYV